MTGRATSNSPRNGMADRMLVAKWLEIKFAQDNYDTALYRRVAGDEYARLVQQLQHDAMHSSLLGRLLSGEEPRP